METIGSGVTAIVVAYLGNRAALKVFGPPVLVLLVPFLEEAAKTGSALLWQGSLVSTHLFFGVAEAFYDLWQGEGRGAASILSLVGHGLFGLVTFLVSVRMGGWFWGLAVATLLHSLWNGVIIGWFGRTPTDKGGRVGDKG